MRAPATPAFAAPPPCIPRRATQRLLPTRAVRVSAPRHARVPLRAALAAPTASRGASSPAADDAGLPLTYDLGAIEAYWSARPGASAGRLAQVAGLFGPWLARVALDERRGVLGESARARAAELREVLVKLGPCYVKLGQALSVRPDLVGAGGMAELRSLCDAVPSFDGGVAMRMVEEELGCGVGEVFKEISEVPVAAASLGQVHKGVLLSGEVVAVKVQRPDMLRSVSLDIYCLQAVARLAGKVQRRFTANRTDYVALLDTWARGTYAELDYCNEMANSRRFASLVQSKMPEIYVPAVYDAYTSRKVLTMEWVSGVPLSDCPPEQINSLVRTGVELFLLQLLSCGYFHSDPHSANLMALPDGRLCVIDFGLMSEIDKAEMDAMVRAIIDLANRNYAGCVRDFVALKFLPPDVDLAAVEKVIAPILEQALEGGGAKSINFQSLSDELASVTFDFPFQIPPAFALLLRALSVLEGIALIGDSEFKLIMASLPFVSRLILTDRSPALREALLETLYKDGVFSPTRLRVLLDSSQGIINDGSAFVDFDNPADDSSVITKDALDLLFSDDGLVIREILSDELAKSLDILVRNQYNRATDAVQRLLPPPFRRAPDLVPGAAMSASAGPWSLVDALSPGTPLLQWLVAPGKLSFALPPVTAAERTQLEGIRDIVAWLTEEGRNNSALLELMPDIVQRSGGLVRLVVGRMGELYAERLFNDLRTSGENINGRPRV